MPSYSGPPESPGSAHTVVWISPPTLPPPEYRTVTLSAVTRPVWVPVVEPLRVTVSPTNALAAVNPPGWLSDALSYRTSA